jgi:hypothetical protein
MPVFFGAVGLKLRAELESNGKRTIFSLPGSPYFGGCVITPCYYFKLIRKKDFLYDHEYQ